LGAVSTARLDPDNRQELLGHLALIVGVSCAFESLFIHHGIGWLFDEGWPLYAAMQLHQGGTLYGDIFFLFPPGHLLPAWIAYALDPPGVVLARIFYAGFNVALCVTIYLLSRNVMKPLFALLAALLLAVAAPRSHLVHVLFGYRYLVFSVLSLMAFSLRLQTGDRRWMGVAGLCSGVALYFRLTPAFAVSCGIAIAVLCAGRDWRGWLRDYLFYAGGLLLIAAPVVAWFASGVGLDALWSHAVWRILPLQAAQSMPVPEMHFPTSWNRERIYEWFVAFQYWLYPALYAGYMAVLAREWYRSIRHSKAFDHALLVAITIWGAMYLLRALGRSDEHHLTTALPPACILLAHVSATTVGWLRGRERKPRVSIGHSISSGLACAAAVGLWIWLQGSDLYFARNNRGEHPIHSLGQRVAVLSANEARQLDRSVVRIQELTGPNDRVLDLTHSPLLYVLANRLGPGYGDIVTPGVFDDPNELRDFVRRLQQAPPALVLWPKRPFDEMRSRSIEVQAPLLANWVVTHYERVAGDQTREIMLKLRALP
jgi:hypothetical protein